MTISRYSLTVLIAGLIVLGAWYGLAQHKAQSGVAAGAVSTPVRATPAARRAKESHAETSASDTGVQSPSPASSYAKAFQAAANYQDFIQSALPAAQKGDRDAEYYLSAALAFCDETYRFFFRRGNKTLSLDEAIAERAALPGNSMTQAIRRAYRRCHGVYGASDPAWGTADQWLAKATEDGQPVAQIRTAEKVFVQITRTGNVPQSQSGAPAVARTITEARSLARAALESRDPEVIFRIGSLVNLLRPGLSPSQSVQEMLTWQYAACLRGLDCSVDSEWLRQFCLAGAWCLPDESGIDYLRRSAQTNMVDLEQKASALNARLDAQAWDEIGLAN